MTAYQAGCSDGYAGFFEPEPIEIVSAESINGRLFFAGVDLNANTNAVRDYRLGYKDQFKRYILRKEF